MILLNWAYLYAIQKPNYTPCLNFMNLIYPPTPKACIKISLPRLDLFLYLEEESQMEFHSKIFITYNYDCVDKTSCKVITCTQ